MGIQRIAGHMLGFKHFPEAMKFAATKKEKGYTIDVLWQEARQLYLVLWFRAVNQ